MGEHIETTHNLLHITLRESLEAIDNLVLNGWRCVLSKRIAGLCQLYGDNAAIRRLPHPCHEPFLFQTVDDTGDCAGLHHDVLGDLGGGQRAVLVEGQEAVELWGADLILLVQLLGVEFSGLHQSADLVDDLFDKGLWSIGIDPLKGRLSMI